MSQLSDNTSNLHSLIDFALNMPKAPKVCNATITGYTSTYRPSKIFFTIMDPETKELTPQQISDNSVDSVFIENVICGSILVVEWSNYGKDTLTGLENLGAYGNVAIFKVTAEEGDEATAIRYYQILT